MTDEDARLAIPPLDAARIARPLRGGRVFDFGGRTMGTTWSVRMVALDDSAIPELRSAVQAALDAVVAQMSQWEPSSDLSQFNRADAGTQHRLPQGFASVLTEAIAIADMTEGAFDPALGAASEAWGFGASAPSALPETALALRARPSIDFDPETRVLLQPGGLQLDFSAIAKGFGVDEAARVLGEADVTSCLVEVGGELRGTGLRPDLQPWWVAIEDPPGGLFLPLHIALPDGAVATSADYRRYHDLGEVRLGHTLDPRTGAPVRQGAESVSVIAPTAMRADALATALMVMGAGAPLFAAHHGIAARIILLEDNMLREYLSPALKAMLS
ncbi:FAD:protein FMN transferase [Novosphingobium sp. 9]|uniref:FAD:protein FMN transferase n=1 Tax=Novosphingobium sp. 9 TaxID=2025349 RepID=UPI0021B50D17|nr:FAD:protein FMN transferase [Novosphingobium sp. 9]